ncbi:MAG: sulfatase [Myxococcota bacterium]
MGSRRAIGLRGLVAALFAAATGCTDASPPNVLLVTLDTTRADHLGAYGHRRDTSPNFDAFAADGTLYTRARSTSSWTLPSHASLFTGKLPSSHGARYDPEGPLLLGSAIEEAGGIRASGLSDEEHTLADRLREVGYTTAGFVAGPWLLETFGLSRGFDHWDDAGILDVNGRPGEDLADAVLAWLDGWRSAEPRRPFFVFVNFFDAHWPYEPPTEYAKAFLPPGATIRPNVRSQFDALYDAEIRYADHHLGRLLDFLREHDLYDDALIVITADHGEMLGEHDEWGHNTLLYEPLVRVPLAVKPPGRPEPRVDDTPTQHTDVYDWILAAAGAGEPEPPRPRIAEVWQRRKPGIGEWKVLWEDDLKYMEHGEGEHRLYDLANDRRERVNRAADRPEDLRRLQEQLAAALETLPAPLPSAGPATIDDATREALERLGYLDGATKD